MIPIGEELVRNQNEVVGPPRKKQILSGQQLIVQDYSLFEQFNKDLVRYLCAFVAIGRGYCSLFLLNKFFYKILKEFNRNLSGFLLMKDTPTCIVYADQRDSWNDSQPSWKRFVARNTFSDWAVLGTLKHSKLVLYKEADKLKYLCENEKRALMLWETIELSSGHFRRQLNIENCRNLTLIGYGQGFDCVQEWSIHKELRIHVMWYHRRCSARMEMLEMAARVETLKVQWVVTDQLCERYMMLAFKTPGLVPRLLKIECQTNSCYTGFRLKKKPSPVEIPAVQELYLQDVMPFVDWDIYSFTKLENSLEKLTFERTAYENLESFPFSRFDSMKKLCSLHFEVAKPSDCSESEQVLEKLSLLERGWQVVEIVSFKYTEIMKLEKQNDMTTGKA